MEVPATVFVAFGAVAAAVVAGFFSFLNLVSSKENKVSEFRQAWIDALRSEIAVHIAALQTLIRLDAVSDKRADPIKWFERTKDSYRDVSESLTKIQLRINPIHAKASPNSHESKLLQALSEAHNRFSKEDLAGAFVKAKELREIAAFFLKDEWERVKNGEERYQRIRDGAQRTISSAIILLAVLAIGALVVAAVR